MTKILSIIIPTYNMEKYLHKCLDSLIVSAENLSLLEVLVINDGSKDASSEIAHDYESIYPQVFKVIDKKNGNYGSCVNCGLQEATGKYVKILDADDHFSNKSLDVFISYLERVDVDLVISDYCIVDEKGKIKETYTFNLPVDRTFTINDFTESTGWLWHHGITYKTSNIVTMNYKQTEGISYTDDEWIFKPMISVKMVAYFPQFLYYYLRGREGQTFDPKVMQKTFSHRMIVANSMVRFYEDHCSLFEGGLKQYMFSKLFSRVRALYNLFLIKGGNQDELHDTPAMISLDQELKRHVPDVYMRLDSIHNKLGWFYIRKWRSSDFDNHILMLEILRLKYRLYHLLGLNVFNIHMPEQIKRGTAK